MNKYTIEVTLMTDDAASAGQVRHELCHYAEFINNHPQFPVGSKVEIGPLVKVKETA
jgi:hypothetical protein